MISRLLFAIKNRAIMKTQNVSAYKHAGEEAEELERVLHTSKEKEKKNPRRYGDEKGF